MLHVLICMTYLLFRSNALCTNHCGWSVTQEATDTDISSSVHCDAAAKIQISITKLAMIILLRVNHATIQRCLSEHPEWIHHEAML